MVSLLLRHGADASLCNNVRERPVDVAADDQIVQLLSRLDRNGHLPDDVTPAAAKRRHPVTSPDDAGHDVVTKKANCEEQDNDVEPCCNDESVHSDAGSQPGGNFIYRAV